jgi:hypothetical protein
VSVRLAGVLALALASTAAAQTPDSVPMRRDSLASPAAAGLHLDGTRLQPGRWLYTHYLLTPPVSAPGSLPAPVVDTTLRVDSVVMPALPSPPDPPRPDSLVQANRISVVRADTSATPVAPIEAAPDTTSRILGPTELVIVDTTYGGQPSWRLTIDGERGRLRFADSLWVGRADLRPQHWGSTQGLGQIAAEFARDSVFGVVTSPVGRLSLQAGLPAGALVNEAMTDAALRILPLAPGYADSVTMLVVDIGALATVRARLSVEGEERVVVPAGLFDAWIVSLTAERGAATYWVAKDSQLVVKVEQVLPQLGGMVLRRELVRAN